MVVIFSVVQLETSFIFFSASDKARVNWHTPENQHRNRGPEKPVGIMVNPVVKFPGLEDQNGQRKYKISGPNKQRNEKKSKKSKEYTFLD